jgi:site-specific DNA recombinase
VDRSANREETVRRVAECDRKLNQYRAALHAGASPATVAGWIAETEAEKARLQASHSRTAS